MESPLKCEGGGHTELGTSPLSRYQFSDIVADTPIFRYFDKNADTIASIRLSADKFLDIVGYQTSPIYLSR